MLLGISWEGGMLGCGGGGGDGVGAVISSDVGVDSLMIESELVVNGYFYYVMVF